MPALSGEIGFADNDSCLSHNDKKISCQNVENGGNKWSDSVHFNVQCETGNIGPGRIPPFPPFHIFLQLNFDKLNFLK